jgi:uncharacterized RDD family membrane protein YckC
MRNIEINTAQNVTIQYELASLKDRILAFLLDSLILWGGLIILGIFFNLLLGTAYDYAVYLILVPTFLFYSILSEIIGNGQSIGKLALSIKVVKLTGKEPSLGDYMMRWVFRFIDIYMSLGSIASLLVSSSAKGQRMGDMLANTAIIKAKPTMLMTLNDLMSISTIDTYTPQYPSIKSMHEEDMLLVKTVIERARKHPNDAHMEALDMMVKYMMEQLGITKIPANKSEFLRTLLRDYIVLTR